MYKNYLVLLFDTLTGTVLLSETIPAAQAVATQLGNLYDNSWNLSFLYFESVANLQIPEHFPDFVKLSITDFKA